MPLITSTSMPCARRCAAARASAAWPEALSVVIQVLYFKLTKGKRFFKMAPIHLHFELLGWSETQVSVRLWMIGMILF